jgi:hypothetical protein
MEDIDRNKPVDLNYTNQWPLSVHNYQYNLFPPRHICETLHTVAIWKSKFHTELSGIIDDVSEYKIFIPYLQWFITYV